jgi:PAS domain S-box-containing protein
MAEDLTIQLRQAFGLEPDADVPGFFAALRDGSTSADPEALKRGCLALFDAFSHAHEAREHSQERLALALNASNLGLWDWDFAAGTVYFDSTLCSFVGIAAREWTWGMGDLVESLHPDDREPFRDALRDTLRGSVSMFHIEHRIKHTSGHYVWLETFGNVTHRDANGRATRMTGTHQDITQRKEMQRAIDTSLRVLQTLLETLPLPVIIRDANRRVEMVNAAWEKMLCIPRADIVGKLLDSDPDRVRTRNHRETDDLVIATRKPLRYETTVHATDGQVYDVIVAKTPLLAEDGSIAGLASVVTDISEQKHAAAVLERARLAAEAAVHAKSRFLANMSHELRTPLNGVVGMASLLEATALDAKQKRFVRTLRTSAEALVSLINDVLDLSKAEAGKLDLAHTSYEPRKEVEQVVGLFAPRAHDKGIEIAAHVARDVPESVHGDPKRLRQVLGNLINNAVKFTDQGAVLLSVRLVPGAEPKLEYSVSDTGCGVAKADQQRIFDAFEQADTSTTRKYDGTGLGLAISRQFVELMRGDMGLESEPGRGSRFYFRVPANGAVAAGDVAARGRDVGALVVGLHPMIRTAVCEAFALESGYVMSVDTPAQAADALGALAANLTRVRILIEARPGAAFESVLRGLVAAAAPRAVEVIALLPADADPTPPPGATRALVKPLCTHALGEARVADVAASTRVKQLPASGSRGRALVVEDNLVNQEMARAMLDMLGFTVSVASNGREGVNAVEADPELDIILMDCQMPVMDGLTAARAIRAAEKPGARIPIVALTGNAMPGDRDACVAAGMDDYLAKPFSLAALRAMLDRWTGGGATTVVADHIAALVATPRKR